MPYYLCLCKQANACHIFLLITFSYMLHYTACSYSILLPGCIIVVQYGVYTSVSRSTGFIKGRSVKNNKMHCWFFCCCCYCGIQAVMFQVLLPSCDRSETQRGLVWLQFIHIRVEMLRCFSVHRGRKEFYGS